MATADKALSQMVSGAIMRLRNHSPFFAALSLFAVFVPSEGIPTACTDGKTIYFNPDYVRKLRPPQLDGLFLHEVLHAALLHALRRGTRDPIRWNIAADVVVNGVVSKQQGVELPDDPVREPTLEHLSVEEIYELLSKHPHPELRCACIGRPPGEGSPGLYDGPDGLRRLAELEIYWKQALRQAEATARQLGHGNLPAGLDRILDQVARSEIDWKAALWRFLVRTPTDFSGFDRRFFHRKLYLETLEGENLAAYVCIDTSGSIDGEQMASFIGEVRGILGAYPHIDASLYYADASVYGPCSIRDEAQAPRPRGGGGTSFVPFFEEVARVHDGGEAVCLYLTDGFGTFPPQPPSLPTLWVVTAGGLDASQFPFGEVVRLLKG